MNKKDLSESDICMKFINPAIETAGWDLQTQVRRELTFTDGKVIVRGKLWKRGKKKRADYVLYWKKNLPIAVIEAKDNKHSIASGMQQALGYADCLDVPFVFSSNGDGFQFHDRTGLESHYLLSTRGHLRLDLHVHGTYSQSPRIIPRRLPAGVSLDLAQAPNSNVLPPITAYLSRFIIE